MSFLAGPCMGIFVPVHTDCTMSAPVCLCLCPCLASSQKTEEDLDDLAERMKTDPAARAKAAAPIPTVEVPAHNHTAAHTATHRHSHTCTSTLPFTCHCRAAAQQCVRARAANTSACCACVCIWMWMVGCVERVVFVTRAQSDCVDGVRGGTQIGGADAYPLAAFHTHPYACLSCAKQDKWKLLPAFLKVRVPSVSVIRTCQCAGTCCTFAHTPGYATV